jgi:tRNA 2-thiocytidine biosynthesis protein TtcA
MNGIMDKQYEFNKLTKRLKSQTAKAIHDFNMIEDNDKIMVCLSGGKDSYTMLDILMSLQKIAPIKFDLIAVNLDQGQPGFPKEILPQYLEKLGISYKIITEDTYSTVKRIIPEGKTTCGLCSRLRRGILYRVAKELGANKIALGHHRDDIIETFFLNMFYGGKLKAMPPKLISDDGNNIVIRPLSYCTEQDIIKFSNEKKFPIIPCDLCGSQPNLQRQVIKEMLQEWNKSNPGRIQTIYRSLQNIVPSHLMDKNYYDFVNIIKTGEKTPNGDTAFDKEVMFGTFISQELTCINTV